MLIDNKDIKLTKQQAIEEHRKMWNWIADWLENNDTPNKKQAFFKQGKADTLLEILKMKYMIKNHMGDMHYNCFCCTYAEQFSDDYEEGNMSNCVHCPLEWTDINGKSVNYLKIQGAFCMHTDYDTKKGDYVRNGLYLTTYKEIEHANFQKAAKVARMIANLQEK